MKSPQNYIIPERDDFGIQRADMSLGLRRASRYYNELVVPGIGGAWKVRHLSWAVTGIYLKQRMSTKNKYSSISIAHGIEALGNKLEWSLTDIKDRAKLHLRGSQAFARSENVWSFKDLCKKEFYVQITHRQQCTRALPLLTGLGFTDGSSRFNSMVLSKLGEDLAKSILLDNRPVPKEPNRLERMLQNWILGAITIIAPTDGLKTELSPLSPTQDERKLVLGRLQSLVSTSHQIGLRDSKRRERLVRFCVEKNIHDNEDWEDTDSLLEWLQSTSEGTIHAKDIKTAIAFEDMRLAGVSLLGGIAQLLGNASDSLPVEDFVMNKIVIEGIRDLQAKTKIYQESVEHGNNGQPDAVAFANEATLNDLGVIRNLVKRDGRILTLDGELIHKGPVFRTGFHNADETEEDPDPVAHFTGRPNRLYQFISLWRDCYAQE